MKNFLKNFPIAKYSVISWRVLRRKDNLFTNIKLLFYFFSDYKKYRSQKQNKKFITNTANLFPRIYDKTTATGLDPVYFFQGTWCAKKIFEAKPEKHYDVGSQAIMVGIISQFTPTIMVDIRPLPLSLPGLSFIKGDITKLPFIDNTINSLSSICVIEHIGLGRYGDPLDTFGSEKAAKELIRVLAKNGSLYISVPIDSENRVYFNAHRAFNRQYILDLFKELTLKEERYVYGNEMFSNYDISKGFGTGLYRFIK